MYSKLYFLPEHSTALFFHPHLNPPLSGVLWWEKPSPLLGQPPLVVKFMHETVEACTPNVNVVNVTGLLKQYVFYL